MTERTPDLTPMEKELLRCVEDALKQTNATTEQLQIFDDALQTLQTNFSQFETALKRDTEQRLSELEEKLERL